MIWTFDAADRDDADFGGPLVYWREYAAIPRFGDYDHPVGDELSIPIIYVPV